MKSRAKEILDAADKYELVNLKLEAEILLVNAKIFSLDNNMFNILVYAD
jgi:hypothetical protein